MPRQVRMAVLAMAAIMALGGISLAQYHDEDDYRYYQNDQRQARDYGYQQGYRDGVTKGRHEGRENDPNDYQDPNWRQASRGYKEWMGPIEDFQDGYRAGYQNGFRSGYQSMNDGWRNPDRDMDEPSYDRGGYVYDQSGHDSAGNVGYRIGFQDGVSQAREDTFRNKPFNTNPRGKYDDRDHGYRREFGDKNSYRAEYTDGYRAGYESAFRRY